MYRSDNLNQLKANQTIRYNLAESLEINRSYMLLPAANNPRDPKQVMDALKVLAQELDREMPTIHIGYKSHPLTGITLGDDFVKIHTPEGTYVSYPVFMKALDSVVQTR